MSSTALGRNEIGEEPAPLEEYKSPWEKRGPSEKGEGDESKCLKLSLKG